MVSALGTVIMVWGTYFIFGYLGPCSGNLGRTLQMQVDGSSYLERPHVAYYLFQSNEVPKSRLGMAFQPWLLQKTCVCVHVYMFVDMHVYMYCICMYVYISIYIYMCIHLCMHIYIYADGPSGNYETCRLTSVSPALSCQALMPGFAVPEGLEGP